MIEPWGMKEAIIQSVCEVIGQLGRSVIHDQRSKKLGARVGLLEEIPGVNT